MSLLEDSLCSMIVPSRYYSNSTVTHTVAMVTCRSTIGAQLLHKMGWKEGQGIGPRVPKKVDNDNDGKLWIILNIWKLPNYISI